MVANEGSVANVNIPAGPPYPRARNRPQICPDYVAAPGEVRLYGRHTDRGSFGRAGGRAGYPRVGARLDHYLAPRQPAHAGQKLDFVRKLTEALKYAHGCTGRSCRGAFRDGSESRI